MLDKLGSPGSEMEKMSGKTFGKADTSIDYPAGTDLVLTLDQPLAVDSTSPPAAATEISPALAEAVQKLLADAPSRAESKTKKPGDPLNLVIVGNSDQILNAFKQAGWSEAKKLGRKSAVGTVRAMCRTTKAMGAPGLPTLPFRPRRGLGLRKNAEYLSETSSPAPVADYRRLPPMAAKSGWARRHTILVWMCTSVWSHTRSIPTWMRNAAKSAPT